MYDLAPSKGKKANCKNISVVCCPALWRAVDICDRRDRTKTHHCNTVFYCIGGPLTYNSYTVSYTVHTGIISHAARQKPLHCSSRRHYILIQYTAPPPSPPLPPEVPKPIIALQSLSTSYSHTRTPHTPAPALSHPCTDGWPGSVVQLWSSSLQAPTSPPFPRPPHLHTQPPQTPKRKKKKLLLLL